MNGVYLSTVTVAHEDERRSLSAIFNGEFVARQVKVLKIKQPSILGNHYHEYAEMFYVFDGEVTYTLESVETGERQVVTMSAGDRLIISPKIAHKAQMAEGTVMIEATEQPFSPESSIRYEVRDS